MLPEVFLHAVSDMGYGIHPFPGPADPHPRLKVDGGIPETLDNHFRRRVPHDPIQFETDLSDDLLCLRDIGIIGDTDGNADPDFLCYRGIIDDIPFHDLIVGDDDDDVVGGHDFCRPEADIHDIPPGGGVGRGRPDLDTVPDLKGPVKDQKDAGNDIGKGIFGRKTDGDPGNARAGDEGHDIDPEHIKGKDTCCYKNDDAGKPVGKVE